ncbi:hypothetical protein JD969_12840 [Planctomycetota bacterium]|nr:hypothetical protein JD969_12840 [Planctomycetota bacterium]
MQYLFFIYLFIFILSIPIFYWYKKRQPQTIHRKKKQTLIITYIAAFIFVTLTLNYLFFAPDLAAAATPIAKLNAERKHIGFTTGINGSFLIFIYSFIYYLLPTEPEQYDKAYFADSSKCGQCQYASQYWSTQACPECGWTIPTHKTPKKQDPHVWRWWKKWHINYIEDYWQRALTSLLAPFAALGYFFYSFLIGRLQLSTFIQSLYSSTFLFVFYICIIIFISYLMLSAILNLIRIKQYLNRKAAQPNQPATDQQTH